MPWNPFRGLKRKAKDKAFGNTQDTAQGVQQQEMADARLGTIYFLGNAQAQGVAKVEVGAFGSFVGNTTILEDMKTASLALVESSGPGRAAVAAAGRVADSLSAMIRPITDMIRNFFQSLLQKIMNVMGGNLDGVEAVGEYAVWAAAELTGVLSSAIPGWGYVQSAADLYEGVKRGVTGASRFIEQMWSGYGVDLLGGHPSVISNALARHSLAMVAGGFKDMAVAGTKIGLEAAGDAFAGVGSLFSAVTGVLQRIANMVSRAVQRMKVSSILAKAKEQWAIRDSEMSLVSNHQDFSEWFQSSVITTPVIAALTLSSGFAAHPYRFLQLIDSSGGITTQAEFDKGVQYIDKLKSISSRYIGEYVDAYRMTFVSDDKLVSARLNAIINGQETIQVEPQWVANPLYAGT